LAEISQFQVPTLTVADLMAMLLLSVAATTDLRWRRVYNWTTYPIALMAAVIALLVTFCQQFGIPFQPFGTLSLGGFLAGAIGCGLVMLIPYQLSGGGAGDVKLAVALGGLLGFSTAFWALAAGYLLAASWVVFKSFWEFNSWSLASGLVRQLGHQVGHRSASMAICPPTIRQQEILAQPMPLAGFFGLGALFVRIGGLPW
jgi:Flp pilus assembly protein protease CpaA